MSKRYILDRVKINKETDCWEWQLSRTKGGYGRCKVGRWSYRAHRLAYESFIGKIPKGLQINHHCDNPCCCNPDHLYAGTSSDNMRDIFKRDRGQKIIDLLVSRNKSKSWVARPVIAEGRRYDSLTAAGKAFGVSDNTIKKRIKSGWDGYSFIEKPPSSTATDKATVSEYYHQKPQNRHAQGRNRTGTVLPPRDFKSFES